MDKKELRRLALKKRVNENIKLSSDKVIDYIVKNNLLDNYLHIGIYYPIGTEIDITKLVDIYKDKKFYLPKTLDEIEFVPYDNNTKLIDGPFHTKEPLGNKVDRDLIECYIIPCVAISKDNQRIGYGKGYYDRYLNGYNGHKIGICYNEFGNCDIRLDSYDLYLDKKVLG